MSQATASLPSTRAPARRTGPHLQALPRAERRARPKLFYAAVAVLTVMVVVVAQLLLSIGVSQGAYRIESLQADKAQLSRSYQEASEKVQKLSSPQYLAANAVALGMVNNGTPVYLRLSDGAVIGSPAPSSASAGSTGQLVGNALTQDIPLVTAPKSSSKSSASNSAAKSSNGTQATGDQTSSGAGSTTPNGNQQQASQGPVPWTGALPAPSTH
ncbi:hypothetical protein ACO2Q7_00540 [Rathayibacter sp. KR2-224]|uniref:hypothetical protein n=1 Tax=Rathayibacter sp. KR2-224 TaxID=3400913 RepID=UPI003C1045BD